MASKNSRDKKDDNFAEVLAAVALAHRVMTRLVTRAAVLPAQAALDSSVGQMIKTLSKILRGRMRALLTPAELSAVHASLRFFTSSLAQKLSNVFDGVMTHVRNEVAALGGIFTSAAGHAGKVFTAKSSSAAEVLARRQIVVAMSEDLHEALTLQLEKIPVNERRGSVIIGELGTTATEQEWKLDRAARTNASAVFNASQLQIIEELSALPEFLGVRKRWTERIFDPSGVPMDNRVARDSMVLHGQIARPSDVFIMPPDSRAPPKMVGQSWQYPPNRPNDRAIILPMLPAWAERLPSYTYENGKRVPFLG